MDFGKVFTAPTQDPDWLRKCALAGLPAITIIGGIYTMGWAVRCFEERRRGVTTLPEPYDDPGGNISRFIGLFVALLPLIGMAVLLGILNFIIQMVLGRMAILWMPVSMVLNLGVSVLYPAAIYLHLTTGQTFVLPDLPRVVTGNKGGLGAYAVLAVVYIIAGFVVGIGAVACWVGIALSMPFGMVVQMAALDEWGRENMA